jgi:hypothetical protein
MKEAGFDLDKIPQDEYDNHIWADGLLYFWHRNSRLPSPDELAVDMLEEWDDPVGWDEADRVLKLLRS